MTQLVEVGQQDEGLASSQPAWRQAFGSGWAAGIALGSIFVRKLSHFFTETEDRATFSGQIRIYVRNPPKCPLQNSDSSRGLRARRRRLRGALTLPADDLID
jgi:hypothetical protein